MTCTEFVLRLLVLAVQTELDAERVMGFAVIRLEPECVVEVVHCLGGPSEAQERSADLTVDVRVARLNPSHTVIRLQSQRQFSFGSE